MNRRSFVKQTTIAATAMAFSNNVFAKSAKGNFPTVRIPEHKRNFKSKAVEKLINEVKSNIKNKEIAWLFENCYPNTLDTTVDFSIVNGKPDTYVITGDIDAMWLRDSSAQVFPYLPLCKDDNDLKLLIKGVINRQMKCILKDPYANAFYKNEHKISEWKNDNTTMLPGVHERKWEIDSLCYPIRLSYHYWRTTGDTTVFDDQWILAMKNVIRTFIEQKRVFYKGPYSFMRETKYPTDSVPLDGYGYPAMPNGLICSMFRPSDDATIFPYLIPSNIFAYNSAIHLSEIIGSVYSDPEFLGIIYSLTVNLKKGLEKDAIIHTEKYGKIYAYEVNGFGSYNLMDDANVPSLLSLGYLFPEMMNDAVYKTTRIYVLSEDNPFFFKGKAAEGIGGPHAGMNQIWHLGIIMRGLTSTDETEIKNCLRMLTETHANTGFMHESFHKDDATKFTRSWFAWANTLFGEFILKVYKERPELLG